MNFQVALELKQKIGSNYEDDGVIYEVLVTPLDPEEFVIYCTYYRIFDFNDESALRYSKKNKFTVRGLYVKGDDVLWEDLSKSK